MNRMKNFKNTIVKAMAGIMACGILIGSTLPVMAQTAPAAAQTAAAGQISIGEAKEIALGDAGMNEKDVVFFDLDQDFDDGFLIQEVKFFSGDMEFSYELDASTGMIMERDRDFMDAEDRMENMAKAEALKLLETIR